MGALSVQLFTVRKHLKSPAQIRDTLGRIRALGIRHIEVARVKFTLSESLVIRDACSDLGLVIGSTQIRYDFIMEHFDRLVDIHQCWNCRLIAVSVLPTRYLLRGEAGMREFARLLNALGRRLQAVGLELLYHHHMEFVRYGSKTGLEILMEATDPASVNLMMDVYWTQRGGKCPLGTLRQFEERIRVVHLRDFRVKLSKLKGDFLAGDCALGDGNLDIKVLVETALSQGVSLLSIEQDTPKPFEELEKSATHLRNLGFASLLDRLTVTG